MQVKPTLAPGGMRRGVDHTKHARLKLDLELKQSALSAVVVKLNEAREDYDGMKLRIWHGLDSSGKALWGPHQHAADLLALSDHDQQQGRIDLRAVHEAVAAFARVTELRARVDQLRADVEPAIALMKRLDEYAEGTV